MYYMLSVNVDLSAFWDNSFFGVTLLWEIAYH